eukprot:8322273-Alexandrium_andersonii.AAC.1
MVQRSSRPERGLPQPGRPATAICDHPHRSEGRPVGAGHTASGARADWAGTGAALSAGSYGGPPAQHGGG